MTSLSVFETMILQSTWSAVLAAATLGVLWNVRSRPVYLWCLSGLLSGAFLVLIWGPSRKEIYDTVFGQYLIGLTVIGAAWLKAVSMRLLYAADRLKPHLTAGSVILAVILILPLVQPGRAWYSNFIVICVSGLMGLFARDAFVLGKLFKLRNARVIASLIAVQLLMVALSATYSLTVGVDPFSPAIVEVPISDTMFGMIMSFVTTAAFIAMVLDLHIRQLDETRRELVAVRVEQSRLEEREQLLAEMHDGFGSQLASAKLRAERGELSQQQVTELLRECMADLHLLVDSLRDQGEGLAAALVDHRYRTERRLTGLGIELDWQIELEDAPRLSSPLTIQVLRIIQEAINNTLKHAHAGKIAIVAQYSDQQGFSIRIEDDGIGIPTQPEAGQGLRNMRRRARDLGAALTIRRGDERGTLVDLRFEAPRTI